MEAVSGSLGLLECNPDCFMGGMDSAPQPAIEQLFAETSFLLAYAKARLDDHHEAEEAVQDCLIAGWNQRVEFAGRSSMRTWLIGILKHKVIDRLRARSRRPDMPDPQAPAADEAEGDPLENCFTAEGAWRIDPTYSMNPLANCPRHGTVRAELRALLKQCIEALPETMRRIFTFREIDQLETREAAEAAGVSASSAPVVLSRARVIMRECLQRRIAR
jgi:RNA polymerase sigma-70 factor (ECF subfamily)